MDHLIEATVRISEAKPAASLTHEELIAEVERLTVENASLRQSLKDARTGDVDYVVHPHALGVPPADEKLDRLPGRSSFVLMT